MKSRTPDYNRAYDVWPLFVVTIVILALIVVTALVASFAISG